MKNQILIFLLGIFITISLAATIPNDTLTAKPAKPIAVVVLNGYTSAYLAKEIRQYIKKGYQYKHGFTGRYACDQIVIMEKY